MTRVENDEERHKIMCDIESALNHLKFKYNDEQLKREWTMAIVTLPKEFVDNLGPRMIVELVKNLPVGENKKQLIIDMLLIEDKITDFEVTCAYAWVEP